MVTGDSIVLEGFLVYDWGLVPAESLGWSVSNTDILRILGITEGKATVTAERRGTGHVIATLNEMIDTAEVMAVQPGDVRWRVAGVGTSTYSGATLDGQGRVYTVHAGDYPGTLSGTSPDGMLLFSLPACWADLSGNTLPNGTSFTNGSRCVRRHAPDGVTQWNVECGSSYGGIAVDTDGSVVCLDNEAGTVDRPVLVRVSSDGTILWRVALGAEWDLESRSAPTIASTGDIYIPWNEVAYNVNWLSRVSSLGDVIWTVPSPGHVDWASPALIDGRIVLSYENYGVASFDSSGVLLWEQVWNTGGNVSSPVIDGEGNVYVQSYSGLYSFSADGQRRWYADSLGSASGDGSGAPTLLSIRSGHECAFVGLKPSADSASEFRQNYDVYIRVFTKLSNPTSLGATLGGDDINVTWQTPENNTQVLRRIVDIAEWDTIAYVSGGDLDYADYSWDYGTSYIYRVRHRSPPVMETIRLSEYSNSDTVAVPEDIIASIVGPTAVRQGQVCAWVGSAAGGQPTYSYQWSGLASGSSSILETSFMRGGSLYLSVTDQLGWIAKDTIEITIDPDAEDCELQ